MGAYDGEKVVPLQELTRGVITEGAEGRTTEGEGVVEGEKEEEGRGGGGRGGR